MGLKDKESGSSSCTPSGLALLLSGAETTTAPAAEDTSANDEVAAAAYVFQQDELLSGDGLYARISEHVQVAVSDPDIHHSAADSRPGRLGPSCVEVDHVAGQMQTNRLTLLSIGNFSSCRANACVFAGKWQYETTICSSGIMQIGWATLQCPFTSEEGVGDAPDSFAFDGKRVKKWHVKCTQYGEAWAAGDVIGCCLDLDRGEASFYRNGRSMGVAFTGIRTMQPHLAYFPAVSLSFAERCELNFGAQPLTYPVPGYQPLQAPPAAGAAGSASYLVACLERLVTGVQPRIATDAGSGTAGKTAASAAAAAAAAAAVAADPRVGAGGRAALRQSFTVPWESWVLMGSILVDQLGPHLWDAYMVTSVLMPAMMRLGDMGGGAAGAVGVGVGTGVARSGAASGGQIGPAPAGAGGAAPVSPLAGLLQLLELCMEPELLSAVLRCLLEALSRRCVSAPLVPEQFPYSASCPYLALAVAIASRPGLRTAWLRHHNLWEVLEGFLTRKSPSPDDLRSLLPHVWWRGCSELSGDRERMRSALQALSAAISRVEEKQYELLCCLLGSPAAADHREDALVEFLRYLVQKNRGATRDIPPPGLSDSTVLISAYLVLVRMLRTALTQVDTFPAGSLFVKTAMKADLEPVNSLARLGGIVTHLCRESPVTSPAELAPLPVIPPSRTSPASPSSSPVSTLSLGGGGSGGGGGLMPSWVSSALGGTAGAWLGSSGSGSSPGPGAPAPASGSPQTPAAFGLASFSSSSPLLFPPPSCEADAWVIARVRACPRVASELVDLAMTLYAFKVGSSIKMTHNLSNSLAANLTGLEEVERHLRARTAPGALAAGPGTHGATAIASYTSYLQEAREFFRQDVSNNIRFASLLKVVFFSGWKQEASLSLAGWLSRLLIAAASQPGPLLAYIPTCFLDCILDTLTSVRHASEATSGVPLPPAAQAPSVAALRLHGCLGDMLAALITLLHEPRICTPDAKEALVRVLAALIDQPGMMAELEASDVARRRLTSSAVAAFDSRLWHPVSQVLLRLVRGRGFGEQQQPQQHGPQTVQPSQAQRSPGLAGAGAAGAGAGGGCGYLYVGSPLFSELLVADLRPERPALQPFLHRLFNMANWATSEFAATVADLHDNRSRRHLTEQQQQYRKAGAMFELVAGLLRLLEFTAARISAAYLASGATAKLNLNRLLEVVSFVLSHFTEGSDARRLTELLTVPPPEAPHGGAGGINAAASLSSTVRIERTLLSEKVNKAMVLAPVVGALLGLWRGANPGVPHGERTICVSSSGDGGGGVAAMEADGPEDTGRMQVSGGGEGPAASGAGSGSGPGPGSRRQALLDALLQHWDAHTEKQMAYLRTVEWRQSLPTSAPAALDAGAREFSELLAAAASWRQQLSAATSGPGGAGSPEEAPEELLDPITSAIMTDPVVLPDSQVTVDRATIERHFLTSQTDPFSRTPLTREALRPNEELKRKIDEWLAARGRN